MSDRISNSLKSDSSLGSMLPKEQRMIGANPLVILGSNVPLIVLYKIFEIACSIYFIHLIKFYFSDVIAKDMMMVEALLFLWCQIVGGLVVKGSRFDLMQYFMQHQQEHQQMAMMQLFVAYFAIGLPLCISAAACFGPVNDMTSSQGFGSYFVVSAGSMLVNQFLIDFTVHLEQAETNYSAPVVPAQQTFFLAMLQLYLVQKGTAELYVVAILRIVASLVTLAIFLPKFFERASKNMFKFNFAMLKQFRMRLFLHVCAQPFVQHFDQIMEAFVVFWLFYQNQRHSSSSALFTLSPTLFFVQLMCARLSTSVLSGLEPVFVTYCTINYKLQTKKVLQTFQQVVLVFLPVQLALTGAVYGVSPFVFRVLWQNADEFAQGQSEQFKVGCVVGVLQFGYQLTKSMFLSENDHKRLFILQLQSVLFVAGFVVASQVAEFNNYNYYFVAFHVATGVVGWLHFALKVVKSYKLQKIINQQERDIIQAQKEDLVAENKNVSESHPISEVDIQAEINQLVKMEKETLAKLEGGSSSIPEIRGSTSQNLFGKTNSKSDKIQSDK